MFKLRYNFLVISALLLPVLYLSGQTSSNQRVVWKAINNKTEFLVLMPEGYETYSDGNYTLGRGTRVDKRISVSRLINGVLLMVDRYDGDIEDIQKDLASRVAAGSEPSQLLDSGVTAGLSFARYKVAKKGKIWYHQFFWSKKGLYVLTAIAPQESNPVSTAFLRSLQLGSGSTAVYPNLEKGTDIAIAAKTTEPIEEILPIRDEDPFNGTPDRAMIVIIKPRPHQFERPTASGEVLLRALFSASGNVSKVDVISGPQSLRQLSIKAAEGIKFIPAEKDGKLVSVWKQFSYSFSSY